MKKDFNILADIVHIGFRIDIPEDHKQEIICNLEQERFKLVETVDQEDISSTVSTAAYLCNLINAWRV